MRFFALHKDILIAMPGICATSVRFCARRALPPTRRALYSILALFLFLPSSVFANDGLVPCTNKCDFNDFIKLLEKIIDFAIFTMAPLIATLMFAIAGFYYITASGDPQKVQSAHTIFRNTIIGFVVVLAAWLIIKAILFGLGATDFAKEYLNI